MWPYTPDESEWLEPKRPNAADTSDPIPVSRALTQEEVDRAVARGHQLRAQAMADIAQAVAEAIRGWLARPSLSEKLLSRSAGSRLRM